MLINLEISIPKPYEPLFKPKRYKIFYGGRYSGKSYNIALALLSLGLQSKQRILCAREIQSSIGDSVHKLLSDLNTEYGFGYEVTNNSLKHHNGSEFLFTGLARDVTKVKSMQGVTICWVEEAENISKKSWDILIPTIREHGAEIWVSFNPNGEDDPTYTRFITPFIDNILRNKEHEDDFYYVRKINYDENPFFNATMAQEIETLKKADYQAYLHVYEGEPLADHDFALIQPSWFESAIDSHKKLKFKPTGAKVVGFDPADEGADSSAMVARYGSVVQQMDDWTTGNLESNSEQVFDYCIANNFKDVVYDNIGVGVGAKVKFNALDPQKNNRYTGFTGSESPTPGKYKDDRLNRDVFRNLRAEWYWKLRDRFYSTHQAITNGEWIDPADMISIDSNCENIKVLKAELTKIRRKQGVDKIQIESKADMKKRGMKSPNLSDALVYCFYDLPIVKGQVNIPTINFTSEW